MPYRCLLLLLFVFNRSFSAFNSISDNNIKKEIVLRSLVFEIGRYPWQKLKIGLNRQLVCHAWKEFLSEKNILGFLNIPPLCHMVCKKSNLEKIINICLPKGGPSLMFQEQHEYHPFVYAVASKNVELVQLFRVAYPNGPYVYKKLEYENNFYQDANVTISISKDVDHWAGLAQFFPEQPKREEFLKSSLQYPHWEEFLKQYHCVKTEEALKVLFLRNCLDNAVKEGLYFIMTGFFDQFMSRLIIKNKNYRALFGCQESLNLCNLLIRWHMEQKLFKAVHGEWSESLPDDHYDGIIDYNVYDDKGNTLLTCAVIEDKLLFVEELICRGANVNKGDSDGRTPLFYAMRDKATFIINAFIKSKKLDYSWVDRKTGNTYFHWCVLFGLPQCLKLFFDASKQEVLFVKNNEGKRYDELPEFEAFKHYGIFE